MRTIRRYSNRKLYDTTASHYLTLQDLGALIRQGEEVQVVVHSTGADITASTMAQIIFEEEKKTPQLPVQALRDIIVNGLK
jgi:polyhydroxyalkanoate synthesis repressor PhaR